MHFHPISRERPFILASASPRRERLLKQVGLPFLTLPSNIPEDEMEGSPRLTTRLLAEKKAKAVHPRSDNNWVLGADTMVVLGNTSLGKPGNRDEARTMLRLLSGKEHSVITAFCLLNPAGEKAHSEEIVTLVRVKALTEDEIEAYIDTREPYGKAGGYGIQGIGAFMIEGITGSYSNVVGLPLCALIKTLIAAGALERFPLPPQPASLRPIS